MDIICNSLILLSHDKYLYYNQLCQRDVKYLEKSKQGLYSTDYCIKAQIRDYKVKLNKENYVENLGEKPYREPKDKFVQTSVKWRKKCILTLYQELML